jgi:hypothetical protein
MISSSLLAIDIGILLLAFNVLCQDPIGLRASTLARQLRHGTGINPYFVRTNGVNAQYIAALKKNDQFMVIESEIKPISMWIGENQYDFTVLGRYHGKNFSWDVVNDVIDDRENNN